MTDTSSHNLIGGGHVKVDSLSHNEEFIPDMCVLNKTKTNCITYRKVRDAIGILEMYEIIDTEDIGSTKLLRVNSLIKIDADLLSREMFHLFINEDFSGISLYKFGISLLELNNLDRMLDYSEELSEILNRAVDFSASVENVKDAKEMTAILAQIKKLKEEAAQCGETTYLPLYALYKKLGDNFTFLTSNEDKD